MNTHSRAHSRAADSMAWRGSAAPGACRERCMGSGRRLLIRASFAVALVVLAMGCDTWLPSSDSAPASGEMLFRTSFEEAADTTGWARHGTLQVRREAPDGGGQWSAFVSGGCVHPHAARNLAAHRDGQLVLRAWGRDLAFGGGVRIRNMRTDAEVYVAVQDSVWTAYETEDALTVQAGDNVLLDMSAGGFIASAMLVDLVEVAWTE